jgi:hypothetical protein
MAFKVHDSAICCNFSPLMFLFFLSFYIIIYSKLEKLFRKTIVKRAKDFQRDGIWKIRFKLRKFPTLFKSNFNELLLQVLLTSSRWKTISYHQINLKLSLLFSFGVLTCLASPVKTSCSPSVFQYKILLCILIELST